MRLAVIVTLLVLAFQTAQAIEPPPPGAAYGTIYVRVTDCANGEPIAGASVSLENPGHTASATTNMTGYAILEGYSWFYSYYVTASGYRIEYGERRFSLGAVFNVCLFRETAGFWRVVASVSAWQGDTHAGGIGWSIIRLKNLEPGVFDIYSLEVWVSGYNRPVAGAEYGNPERLGRLVEREFNITVAPPADSPIGRLAAELRMRAVFTYDDGRKIGPLTVPVSLDYVQILPYRSFRLRLLDFWGLNPVSQATVVMETTIAGAWSQHVLHADDEGYVSLDRLRDGVYNMRVYYSSPYDGDSHLVRAFFPILVDLARAGEVRTWLYDARVEVVDLAGRPLNTTVSIGEVSADTVNGVAYFKNVPKGRYNVRAWWMGSEVFNGSITVDEPFSKPSPGGVLRAVADVGDLILTPRDKGGERLGYGITLKLEPLGLSQQGQDLITFPQLPRGEYTVEAIAYNSLLGHEVTVGQYTFRIPEDHGTHELRMEIYDLTIQFHDAAGRPAEVDAAVGAGRFHALNGSIILEDVAAGEYPVIAWWMDVSVFEGNLKLPEEAEIGVSVYPLMLTVKTLDGGKLVRGLASIEVAGQILESDISDGTAYFQAVPAGSYNLMVQMDSTTVYKGDIRVGGDNVEIVADAAYLRIMVRDQTGRPLGMARAEVEDVGAAITDESGLAEIGQVPKGKYTYIIVYNGLPAGMGTAEAGITSTAIVEVYPLMVEVVNELEQPIEAEVEVSVDSRFIGRQIGSTVVFPDMPRGTYTVRASYASKQVEQQVTVSSANHQIRMIMPFAVYIGPGMILSLSDIWTIATPITLAIIAAALTLAVRTAIKKTSRRHLTRV
jgi:hypothetical protein